MKCLKAKTEISEKGRDMRRILNVKVDDVKEEKEENLKTRVVILAQAMGSVCQPDDIDNLYM